MSRTVQITALDFETLGFNESAWSDLTSIGELRLYGATNSDIPSILAHAQNADVLLTNKVPLPEAVFSALPKLKLVSVLATGYNVIDLQAAAKHAVTICNVPAYSSASTAQHAVALILELCNQCGLHSRSVHQGEWIRSKHFSYWKKPVIELTGKTVGLVGFGDIGRRVATVLHTMGARIQACVRRPRDTPDWEGFRWVDTEELFATADIVSLHCPETPDNHGFVNADLLARMKPGAMLINTARGGLVDEAALADALRSRHLAGAAADVISAEPMREENPLFGAPNCILTPHIAWASAPSRSRLLEISIENIKAFIAGKPQNVVS
ncbi:MAG: D-2-hydroxyacid dehydrogenase [Coraliomargaritaceae bacterium]